MPINQPVAQVFGYRLLLARARQIALLVGIDGVVKKAYPLSVNQDPTEPDPAATLAEDI